MYVGYGIMSSLKTKGLRGCPTCGPDLDDIAQTCKSHGKVICLGHIKYFPLYHAMRMNHELLPWEGKVLDTHPIPICKVAAYWKQVFDAKRP